MKASVGLFLFGQLCLGYASPTDPPCNNGTNSTDSSSLPISSAGYYNFSNIRYAAPPVGDLRFAAPQAPKPNRTVQTGQVARICPVASPVWESVAAEFVPGYLLGQKTFNDSIFDQPSATTQVQDPTTDEDCLFLDVFVPQKIWDQRKSVKKFPVMFWIFGGGYTEGSKIDYGSPAGILNRSETDSDGVIYVAPNYRLGAFGWLSGPTFQQDGGLSNAGLYDQRFALQWVQKYIHLFGGDPHQVTVFGESAGGGSIVHHITAFGGVRNPFKRAIVQSPGFQPTVSRHQQETIFQNFLKAANVTTLAEARQLPYEQLQLANLITVGASPYGTYTYGPVVDGLIAPSTPGELLALGKFDKHLSVMTGQNQDEGLIFTSPLALKDSNDTELRKALLVSVPTLVGLPDQVDYILKTLYPPIYDGSQAQSYKDEVGRSAAILSEIGFICNNFYLAKAYHNRTYSYLFDVFPAVHALDADYTYYPEFEDTPLTPEQVKVALELQDYITSFAITGSPNKKGVPFFQMYGKDAQVQVLETNDTRVVMDPAANRRCNYWNSGLWY
ncbi:alpha/beta-hydrolase [Myriangium duriaei CBS 260.36]|uniref:Carboxylic ester hydrolase n=1 Tax=Myriangium duriaei CBS 260.36 TaxID=1168546 RepID=A0A9P4J977_9PEZI|nr:alpha/beta-hydrolase [Myriangium duriaei CBS 260.36]